MENYGLFHRTLAFNKGMRNLESNYLIAGDTDVFIDPLYLLKGKKMFEKDDKLGILHPYNGMFVHLKQHLMDKFTSKYEMNLLNDKIGELKPVPYHETDNFLVAHPGSKGGMVMYNKERFIKFNGYNQNFVAWGFEDDEIIIHLDGDDWFINEQVLEKLNKFYNDNDVWMTYGGFVCWDGNDTTVGNPQNTA